MLRKNINRIGILILVLSLVLSMVLCGCSPEDITTTSTVTKMAEAETRTVTQPASTVTNTITNTITDTTTITLTNTTPTTVIESTTTMPTIPTTTSVVVTTTPAYTPVDIEIDVADNPQTVDFNDGMLYITDLSAGITSEGIVILGKLSQSRFAYHWIVLTAEFFDADGESVNVSTETFDLWEAGAEFEKKLDFIIESSIIDPTRITRCVITVEMEY